MCTERKRIGTYLKQVGGHYMYTYYVKDGRAYCSHCNTDLGLAGKDHYVCPTGYYLLTEQGNGPLIISTSATVDRIKLQRKASAKERLDYFKAMAKKHGYTEVYAPDANMLDEVDVDKPNRSIVLKELMNLAQILNCLSTLKRFVG